MLFMRWGTTELAELVGVAARAGMARGRASLLNFSWPGLVLHTPPLFVFSITSWSSWIGWRHLLYLLHQRDSTHREAQAGPKLGCSR
jgi:hypothetical protein